jgi:hypothetical protein
MSSIPGSLEHFALMIEQYAAHGSPHSVPPSKREPRHVAWMADCKRHGLSGSGMSDARLQTRTRMSDGLRIHR